MSWRFGWRFQLETVEELSDRLVRIQTNLSRIGADERTAEDPARQLGDVVALERLQRGQRDLCLRGDLSQRHATVLARVAKLLAEVGHPVRHLCTPGMACQRVTESGYGFGNVPRFSKKADRRDTGCTGPRRLGRAAGRDPADREDRE